jgi:hypothetical protein
VIFVVDKVPVEKVFLHVLLVSSVSIIPPILHTHLRLRVAVSRKTNGRNPGNLKKEKEPRSFTNSGGGGGGEKYKIFFFFFY